MGVEIITIVRKDRGEPCEARLHRDCVNNQEKWSLNMAEAEDNCDLAVGGLAQQLTVALVGHQ